MPSKSRSHQRGAGLATYAALREDLVVSGELIVTEALADVSLTNVQVRDGQALTTDGPFAEVKEQLAARVPEAALGLVRPRS